MGNTAEQCRLALFQDSDSAGDLEDSEFTSGARFCVLGSHTFVPISWMCKNQTSVSHSSTESENHLFLDTGQRLDGLSALELWDLIVSVLSVTILDLRALQGHSGHNLIDPTLQDNVLNQRGIFHHIYHIGCAFNLHSIINNGLIPGGQDLSRRQTVFFLPIDPRDESHKDPEHIDFSVPRRARYLHNAWKKHQDAVYWVNIDLAIRKGLTFYQTRSNAVIFQEPLPAYCIPEVVRLKIGEVLYEKSYISLRPPPKIS